MTSLLLQIAMFQMPVLPFAEAEQKPVSVLSKRVERIRDVRYCAELVPTCGAPGVIVTAADALAFAASCQVGALQFWVEVDF